MSCEDTLPPGRAHLPGRPRKDGSVRRVLAPRQSEALAALDTLIQDKQAEFVGVDTSDPHHAVLFGQWQFLTERRRSALSAWGLADEAGA